MATVDRSAEFLILQRISTNRCMRKFARRRGMDKQAQWYVQAGRFLGRAAMGGARGAGRAAWSGARGVGRYIYKHPGKAMTAGFVAYGVPDTVRQFQNLRNTGGSRYMTADGHRKSTAATVLKTIGDWAWAIPGVNLLAGITLGVGANWLGNAIQNRADKDWATAQNQLMQSGYVYGQPGGKYNNSMSRQYAK